MTATFTVALETLSPDALTNLGWVGVGAAVSAVLARRLGQPTVVGFLLAGILLGPVAGLVSIGPLLDALAEFGIVLLLFLVGLELSVDEVREVGAVVLVAGAVQLVLTGAGGYALGVLLGFSTGTSLFLAAAVAFSSTVVVVKMLVDAGDIQATHGRLAVGILLLQDLVVVILLTLLPVLGDAGANGDAAGVATQAALATGATLLLVAATLAVARLGLAPVFRWSSASPDLLLLVGLAWLVVVGGVSTVLGVSLEVGAFAAGLGLAPIPYANELRRRVHPLLDLFIALFFVSLGARFALDRALGVVPAILTLSVFVIVAKIALLTLVLGRLGYARETSFRTGVSLAQVSEFSFILSAVALEAGLIAETDRDLVIGVGLVTIAASAILAGRSRRLYAWVERVGAHRILPHGWREPGPAPAPPSGHVLLLGWDAVGAALARTLTARGEHVRVVAIHPDVPNKLPDDVDGVYANPADLQAVVGAGLDTARLVIANVREPGPVRVLLEHAGDHPPIIARAETAAVARILRREGAYAVLTPSEIVAGEALRTLTRATDRGELPDGR